MVGFSADELRFDDQRFEMLLRLLTRSHAAIVAELKNPLPYPRQRGNPPLCAGWWMPAMRGAWR